VRHQSAKNVLQGRREDKDIQIIAQSLVSLTERIQSQATAENKRLQAITEAAGRSRAEDLTREAKLRAALMSQEAPQPNALAAQQAMAMFQRFTEMIGQQVLPAAPQAQILPTSCVTMVAPPMPPCLPACLPSTQPGPPGEDTAEQSAHDM
jgi:hypothetical protein